MFMPARTAMLLSFVLLIAASVVADDKPPAELGTEAPFKLDLPEWNPKPEDLPPELRPLDIERPTLPEMAAKEVAELEARIEELETTGLTAETREAQDAALDEAIRLAERVLAIREQHQGRTSPLGAKWTGTDGASAEWYEVGDARRLIEMLCHLRTLSSEDRTALGSVEGKDPEAGRLYRAGRYAEAYAMAKTQLDICRRVVGDQHPATLRWMNNCGAVLGDMGRPVEGEQYLRQVMEARRRVLGNEHPDTLIAINNCGATLYGLGRAAEATICYREALSGRRRVLGNDHPDALLSLNTYGVALIALGRFAEAELYCREAMSGRRRVLGPDDRSTLISIGNYGMVLHNLGRISEAELFYGQALEGFRRTVRAEDPDRIIATSRMASVLQDQGRLTEAEDYCRLALEGLRNTLGEEHRSTLAALADMGTVLGVQKRLTEAEPYFWKALNGYSRVLGTEHPDTLLMVSNVGSLLFVQGKLSEAEPYCRQALEGQRDVLGDAHVDTLRSTARLGALLTAQGRPGEAEPYLREALATAERVRLDVIGGAQERAAFAGRLNLPAIAAGHALTLVELDRAAEALSALERGRSRAALDLMAGGTAEAERALRAAADVETLARYDAALAAEEHARTALFEAESRMAAAPDSEKAGWRERVKAARLMLSEKTAAVFAELRGLVPAAIPLNTEEILAALEPGEAILSYSWTADGAIAVLARGGQVHGVMLAKGKDEATAAHEKIESLRQQIATRAPSGEGLSEKVMSDARAAVLPKELMTLLDGGHRADGHCRRSAHGRAAGGAAGGHSNRLCTQCRNRHRPTTRGTRTRGPTWLQQSSWETPLSPAASETSRNTPIPACCYRWCRRAQTRTRRACVAATCSSRMANTRWPRWRTSARRSPRRPVR